MIGLDSRDQKAVDAALLAADGTPDKKNLGANAILGVSLAAARAGAAAHGRPLYAHLAVLAGRDPNTQLVLPVPAFNVINGGSHAGTKLARPEIRILPTGVDSFPEVCLYLLLLF